MKVSTTITLDEDELRSLVALATISHRLMTDLYEKEGVSPGEEGFSFSFYTAKESASAFYAAEEIADKLTT